MSAAEFRTKAPWVRKGDVLATTGAVVFDVLTDNTAGVTVVRTGKPAALTLVVLNEDDWLTIRRPAETVEDVLTWLVETADDADDIGEAQASAAERIFEATRRGRFDSAPRIVVHRSTERIVFGRDSTVVFQVWIKPGDDWPEDTTTDPYLILVSRVTDTDSEHCAREHANMRARQVGRLTGLSVEEYRSPTT